LVCGHIGEHQAHDLRRIEILGNGHRVAFRHAYALGVRAPDRQHADAVADSEPRAARTKLLDDAHELVSRRERWFRTAEIRASAELRIGERCAGGEDPHADFAGARKRRVRLDDIEDLGTAEACDDYSPHGRGR
jgi:hypothetical protein